MRSRKVVLFGNGDFARVASVYLEKDSPHEVVAFTVHEEYRRGPTLLGKPVIPFEEAAHRYPPDDYAMFVAIGFSGVNSKRAEIYHLCKDQGYELITYICSRATCWGEIEIGDNCFVFENNVLQPFATVGSNTVLWSGNHIGHDATIGNHCFITSHAVISGHAKVGDYCFIGVNATLRDRVEVGKRCVIGAGTLVLRDVPSDSVVKGQATALSPVPSHRLRAI